MVNPTKHFCLFTGNFCVLLRHLNRYNLDYRDFCLFHTLFRFFFFSRCSHELLRLGHSCCYHAQAFGTTLMPEYHFLVAILSGTCVLRRGNRHDPIGVWHNKIKKLFHNWVWHWLMFEVILMVHDCCFSEYSS